MGDLSLACKYRGMLCSFFFFLFPFVCFGVVFFTIADTVFILILYKTMKFQCILYRYSISEENEE